MNEWALRGKLQTLQSFEVSLNSCSLNALNVTGPWVFPQSEKIYLVFTKKIKIFEHQKSATLRLIRFRKSTRS